MHASRFTQRCSTLEQIEFFYTHGWVRLLLRRELVSRCPRVSLPASRCVNLGGGNSSSSTVPAVGTVSVRIAAIVCAGPLRRLRLHNVATRYTAVVVVRGAWCVVRGAWCAAERAAAHCLLGCDRTLWRDLAVLGEHSRRRSERQQPVDSAGCYEGCGPQQRHAVPPLFKPNNFQGATLLCRSVVDVQRTFDAEEPKVLLIELEHLHGDTGGTSTGRRLCVERQHCHRLRRADSDRVAFRERKKNTTGLPQQREHGVQRGAALLIACIAHLIHGRCK